MEKNIIKFMPVLFLLLFSGCWDSRDIQQKDIHITQIVDYKDSNYILYGEVADLSAGAQKNGDSEHGESNNFYIVMAEGKTLTQARDEINRKSSMPLYLGAGRILAFTDRMSSLGLEEYLNRSRAQQDTRKSLKIVTTSVEPEELLTVDPDNSASVGLAIDNMLESMVENGSSFRVTIGDILEVLAVKKAGFLIPEIGIKDSDLTLMGYTVFRNAKKAGFIPARERNGIIYFLQQKASFSYEIETDSGTFNLKVTLQNKKITTGYQNEQLALNVVMRFKAELNYADEARILSDSDINRLQTLLEQTIMQEITHSFDTSQEYECDFLGIYRYFRAKHYDEFKTIDWGKTYSEASIDVKTKVLILSSKLTKK